MEEADSMATAEVAAASVAAATPAVRGVWLE